MTNNKYPVGCTSSPPLRRFLSRRKACLETDRIRSRLAEATDPAQREALAAQLAAAEAEAAELTEP